MAYKYMSNSYHCEYDNNNMDTLQKLYRNEDES